MGELGRMDQARLPRLAADRSRLPLVTAVPASTFVPRTFSLLDLLQMGSTAGLDSYCARGRCPQVGRLRGPYEMPLATSCGPRCRPQGSSRARPTAGGLGQDDGFEDG